MRTIDFETEAIVGNPIVNPPKPIGVGIKVDGGPSEYYTGDLMEYACALAWESGEDLLFHNAPFDLAVARKWLGLPTPRWSMVHDTQYLIYLYDPHAKNLGLKPSAERILKIPPAERDELKDWVMRNVPKAKASDWGAYICEAPLELVSKYCRMDVDMTYALYRHLIDKVPIIAYNRERRLEPILTAATIRGVRVNTQGLEHVLAHSQAAQAACEQRIRAMVGVPNLNPHSGSELAAALESGGFVTEWEYTEKGNKRTARECLMRGIENEELKQLLTYTSAMQTCIGTYMEPWLFKAGNTGRLHPNWNQVKSEGKGGTRTGRMSSSDPNFQNIPVPFEFPIPKGLAPMPEMRDFILPEDGHVWVSRDFASQEMRLLAHFENGELCEAFNEDPELDPHSMVQELIEAKTGLLLKRKHVKNIGFGIMYGMGIPGLSKQLGVGRKEAMTMVNAYHLALPGIERLQDLTKTRGKMGKPIFTTGGRLYYAEPPQKMKGGRTRSFEYKLLNYLIQGSAADQTKDCIIEWNDIRPLNNLLTAPVHDEINISVPKDDWRHSAEILGEAMANGVALKVPMLSDIQVGDTWGSIAPVDKL